MEQTDFNFVPRNLLDREASPYLLQHASNPVFWRPWGKDAMAEARQRDCPILLSVGYAACHWCHVMAHESFENPETANLMNSFYVNVKVDREERPDIDQIYMAALSSMGQQGGWPLTMFLTPDGKPFWGGTYLPPTPRHGQPSFSQILFAVHDAWKTKRADIEHNATALAAHVQTQLARAGVPSEVDLHEMLAEALLPRIDEERGGMSGAPKFPNAPFMYALWLNWLKTRDPRYCEATLNSLRHMLCGGIYDHIGGGLARYSTDADWMIPHFEKMLYDNAQMIRQTNWAYSACGDNLFRSRIKQTVQWLCNEMLTPQGFASSLDADNAGEEGQFYCWTAHEIEAVTGLNYHQFSTFFSLGSNPHWEGSPVVFQTREQFKAEQNDPEPANLIRQKLLEFRNDNRVKPPRDDKVLTDWNGLAIQALAEAGRSLGKPDWIETAASVFSTIAGSGQADGRLPHSNLDGRKQFPAFSSDYAAMINAAVSLFEATGNANYLNTAQEWVSLLDRWYADDPRTGYFLTASDAQDVPLRLRGDVDEATPSANAQIIEALTRLASATGNQHLALQAQKIASEAIGRVSNQSYGQAGIAVAHNLAANPSKLVLVGPENSELVAVANRNPDPRRVDVVHVLGQGGRIEALPDGTLPSSNSPGAWLCTNRSCRPVITNPSELERALQE
ncbi:MAG: thioredoxin domain-containing protein [Rhizobiaceae bacterium]|nr:thioredoxin domain-containing protein [Rhizobiaceae bacterium]